MGFQRGVTFQTCPQISEKARPSYPHVDQSLKGSVTLGQWGGPWGCWASLFSWLRAKEVTFPAVGVIIAFDPKGRSEQLIRASSTCSLIEGAAAIIIKKKCIMHCNLGCKGEVHGTWESAAKMKRRHWVPGRGSPCAKPWIGKVWVGKWVGEHPWREKGIKRYLSVTVFSPFNSSLSSLHNPMRKVLLPGPSRISWDQRTFPGAMWSQKWQAWQSRS